MSCVVCGFLTNVYSIFPRAGEIISWLSRVSATTLYVRILQLLHAVAVRI